MQDADMREHKIVHDYTKEYAPQPAQKARKTHHRARLSQEDQAMMKTATDIDRKIRATQKSLDTVSPRGGEAKSTNEGIWNKSGFNKTPSSSYAQ